VDTNDIEPVTTLKRDAAALIERARTRASPIVITQNGRATAVLQDIDTYERQRRALSMLKLIAQGERDLDQGATVSHTEAKKRLRAKLRALTGE